MNNGFQNERDFVELFNNKYLYELDDRSIVFLKELFGEVIDNKEIIACWKNKMVQKADIFIKYKNYVKSVSLYQKNADLYGKILLGRDFMIKNFVEPEFNKKGFTCFKCGMY